MLGESIEMTPIVSDLETGILVSNENEFIISDNPVICINPFLEKRNHHTNGLGLGCIGIMIIFPYSPKQALVLFDGYVYSLGSRKNHMPMSKLKFIQYYTRGLVLPLSPSMDISRPFVQGLIRQKKRHGN